MSRVLLRWLSGPLSWSYQGLYDWNLHTLRSVSLLPFSQWSEPEGRSINKNETLTSLARRRTDPIAERLPERCGVPFDGRSKRTAQARLYSRRSVCHKSPGDTKRKTHLSRKNACFRCFSFCCAEILPKDCKKYVARDDDSGKKRVAWWWLINGIKGENSNVLSPFAKTKIQRTNSVYLHLKIITRKYFQNFFDVRIKGNLVGARCKAKETILKKT